ncbi:heparin-binding hemagglutinin [Nocardia blacklockiae]|uniref:heparin-binding hemagglutinin n=1 Tax=Nocardia blacklockiae TaxID=480036 RepID=UPI0018930FCE|nr:heparin-binding hemagglutinin [Nocardia blacklockiae]MBF6172935.1 heparin-binding hemagglutinin [Nocardia blacklockiae]
MTESHTTATVRPLYATVGAGDALYAAVNDLVVKVRERAATADVSGRVEEARERLSNLPADAQEQFGTLRQRVSALPSELPDDIAELRERFTPEELRRLVDQYYHQLLDLYSDLAERGEETVGRLRSENTSFDEQFGRVEGLYNDLATRAEDVLGKVGEQARGLLGQKVAEAESAAESVVDAEVVQVTTEPATAGPAKKAPAKKAPAKKAPAKKTTAAKK